MSELIFDFQRQELTRSIANARENGFSIIQTDPDCIDDTARSLAEFFQTRPDRAFITRDFTPDFISGDGLIPLNFSCTGMDICAVVVRNGRGNFEAINGRYVDSTPVRPGTVTIFSDTNKNRTWFNISADTQKIDLIWVEANTAEGGRRIELDIEQDQGARVRGRNRLSFLNEKTKQHKALDKRLHKLGKTILADRIS